MSNVTTHNLYRAMAIFALLLCWVTPGQANHPRHGVLVDARWLAQHLHEPDLVIIDARSVADYAKGHIEGAVNVPATKTFSPAPPQDRVAGGHTIAPLFSAAGIGHQTTVVVYDDGNFVNAARLVWVLHLYGHQWAGLLRVGFQHWHKQALPVSNQPANRRPAKFIPRIRPEQLATLLRMRLSMHSQKTTLIDVRTAREFLGQESQAARSGRIPTAVNIEPVKMLGARVGQGPLKILPGISDELSRLSVASRVIVYGNNGLQASLPYIVLRELGYSVAIYDGAWGEWGNRADLPIESSPVN